MSYTGTTTLFAPGPNPRAPALSWRSDAFFAVDDTLRGGSSHSHINVVQYPPPNRGEIVFSGFLDTTTLGGAGFASQAYSSQLPVTLSRQDFTGLRIVVRKTDHPPQDPTPGGGGKGPVKSFVFQIKTEVPQRRPDGRRESVIVWEWSFVIPDDNAAVQTSLSSLNHSLSWDDFWVFDSLWQDFRPFYRGRPVDDDKAGDFQPEKTVEWSLMARSNFQIQSGPFSVQVHSLSAIDKVNPESALVDEKTRLQHSFRDEQSEHVTQASQLSGEAAYATASSLRHRSSSSEYYGFALFILATVLWVIWVIWALTPDHILHLFGIEWYPNREWAFLIPAWSLVIVLTIYAVFIGINMYKTPDLGDIRNVTDSVQNVYRVSMDDETHVLEDEKERGKLQNDFYDLPPGYVSRQLYLSPTSQHTL